jgi:GT2 family glycosyltransferase
MTVTGVESGFIWAGIIHQIIWLRSRQTRFKKPDTRQLRIIYRYFHIGRQIWEAVEKIVNVAVIIVNYNSGKLLATCLEHLANQSRPADQIIVVDNASEDNSLADLPARAPCQIVELAENTGFAKANNTAIAAATEADLIITLNPDAFPATDFVARLEQAAASYPGHASFACRMMTDAHTLDGAGDSYHVSGFVWRDQHGHAYTAQDTTPYEVFSACAGAAMYRRDKILEAGGFDETFFCYVEDIDLGYRLRLRGERCLYIPGAVVTHIGSAISSKYPGFALYHGHRNLVWALLKNTPPALLFFMLPVHIVLTIAAGGLFLYRGQFGTFLRAKIDAIREIPRIWRLRAAIQRNRTVSTTALLRSFDYSLWPRRKHR